MTISDPQPRDDQRPASPAREPPGAEAAAAMTEMEESPMATLALERERTDAAHRGVMSAARVVMGVTLISRFGGLFRDGALTRVLGEGAALSAFNFAFVLPNVFRRLFGEGALSAAFIPEYAALEREDRARSDRFASLVLLAAAGLTILVTLLIEGALLAALWLAPPSGDRRLVLELSMLMLPYMPLICLSAVLSGILQTHHRFGLASAGPIILNTVIIAATLIAYFVFELDERQTAYLISIAVTLSGVALLGSFIFALRRLVRWTTDFRGVREQARRTFRRFVPAAVGLAGLQMSSILDGLIATYPMLVGATLFGFLYPLDEGTNGILGVTQRLYQFPLGIFGNAIAMAVFPSLARAKEDPALFTDMVRRGLRLSLFISLPASIGLALVGEDLARVLFRGGNFTEDDVRRSAHILLGYALSVWAFSANQTLTRAFFAKGDTRTPVIISLWCVGINILGNVTLIWVPWIGEAAFGWSTAVSSVVQFMMLTRAVKPLLQDGRLLDASAMQGGGVTLECTFIMGLVVAVLLELMPGSISLLMTAVRLAVCCAVGVGVYFFLSKKRKMEEVGWLLARRVPLGNGKKKAG